MIMRGIHSISFADRVFSLQFLSIDVFFKNEIFLLPECLEE